MKAGSFITLLFCQGYIGRQSLLTIVSTIEDLVGTGFLIGHYHGVFGRPIIIG